jgi:hypothetical protein
MRSNIIHSIGAVLAVFTQLAAVFLAFGLPAATTADHPVGAVAAGSATHEQDVRGIAEVIVKVRRAI